MLARLFERRSYHGVMEDPARIPSNGSVAASAAGVAVNDRTALRHIDVYACQSLIADALAMLPVRAFRRVSDVERQPVRSSLVEQPSPSMTPFDFWQRLALSVLGRGNAYAMVTARDANDYATQLTPVHPDDVLKVDRDPVTKMAQYRVRGVGVVPRYDMMHVPGFILPGELTGMSVLEAGRGGIALSMAAEEFGANFFGDGATPSSVLESDQPYNEDEAKAASDAWKRAHGNRHRYPAVLMGGLKWKQITITPEESQFLETRQFQTSQIARLHRVPPHMIGDVERSTSWGSGIEEQGIGFVVYTLGPWLCRFEQGLSALLPRGQFAKFNVSALLRGNAKDRFLAYAIGRQWGWLCVDDIRALEDLTPLPDGAGQTYLQPLNMVDASQALDLLLSKVPSQGGPPQ